MTRNQNHAELTASELHRRCDLQNLAFETTDELDDPTEVVAQARAAEALRFGVAARGDGFNVYALGPEEADKRTVVEHFVAEKAGDEPAPPDLCYVNNFEEAHRPEAFELPSGVGRELARDMDRLVEELKPALTAAFESEEYQTRKAAVQERVGEEQQEEFELLQEKAQERGLTLLRTPAGFVFAPVKEGEVVPPDEIEELDDEEQERLEGKIEELQEELRQILRRVPRQQREARDQVRKLNREIARYAVRDLLQALRQKYEDVEKVPEFLDAVEEDVVRNVETLIRDDGHQPPAHGEGSSVGGAVPQVVEQPGLRRYRVNVLVDHGDSGHAPVVYENNPTYQNLVGRIEYLPQMGALVTDFNLIKPGALHRANGGYLVLDARRVLLHPFAWEGLKRALQSRRIQIESPREALGLVSTVSLDPEPISLDLKVILLGDRMLYYLLSEYDPEFGDLFKVEADFSDRMDRTPENEELYARLVAGLVHEEELLPFDRSAVARVIERSARLVGDSEKLSVRSRGVLDLIREADHWAVQEGADVVTADHVQEAIDKRIHRSDRLRERVQEEILRDTLYVDTEGETVGQVNGLSVVQLGDFSFGRPNRITARVRLGKGEVVDIEREVELGGPIHSKGVLILSGFLGARYASDRPLSLSASLVFEQSYGGIEGDSASSAELFALLSSIADVPVSQAVSVTGSVNQHGEIQPIGGVNEKIEGFFDICEARGLTGDQGVLIPAANVKHLMLRRDVVEAVEEGEFHVWPIRTVDAGMEILTGRTMGERDEEGNYPEGTVNHQVERRLARLAERRLEFASDAEG